MAEEIDIYEQLPNGDRIHIDYCSPHIIDVGTVVGPCVGGALDSFAWGEHCSCSNAIYILSCGHVMSNTRETGLYSRRSTAHEAQQI